MEINKKMKILVAEDSPSVRKALLATLKELGFSRVNIAPDGQKALSLIKKYHTKLEPDPFELIFTDIVMPKVNGIELIDAIRQSGAGVDIPIIVISSEKDVDTVLSAAEKGADEYVFKPFIHHEVMGTIEKVLKKKKGIS